MKDEKGLRLNMPVLSYEPLRARRWNYQINDAQLSLGIALAFIGHTLLGFVARHHWTQTWVTAMAAMWLVLLFLCICGILLAIRSIRRRRQVGLSIVALSLNIAPFVVLVILGAFAL